jgi:hypothetical protein
MLSPLNGIFEWEIPMSTNVCSFSWKHYREILEVAKNAGYKFLLFNEINSKTTEKCCLLRHDIDYAPEKAIEFGRIESTLGIRSTYFYQVSAWTYNTRERSCFEAIQTLNSMGHQIALHFDVTWWEGISSVDELVDACTYEKDMLARMTNIDISDIVSFHNPHTYADKVINKTLTGIHHTYEPKYFSDFKYLSDSQGWYEGCVCKLFESQKYQKIQLLTHPYIWSENPQTDFIEDMVTFINTRRDQLTEYMVKYHPVCKKNQDRFRSLLK